MASVVFESVSSSACSEGARGGASAAAALLDFVEVEEDDLAGFVLGVMLAVVPGDLAVSALMRALTGDDWIVGLVAALDEGSLSLVVAEADALSAAIFAFPVAFGVATVAFCFLLSSVFGAVFAPALSPFLAALAGTVFLFLVMPAALAAGGADPDVCDDVLLLSLLEEEEEELLEEELLLLPPLEELSEPLLLELLLLLLELL